MQTDHHTSLYRDVRRETRGIFEKYRSRRIYGRTFVETTNERNDCRASLVSSKFERKRKREGAPLFVNYNENFLFLGARKRRKENKSERKKIGKKWRQKKKEKTKKREIRRK